MSLHRIAAAAVVLLLAHAACAKASADDGRKVAKIDGASSKKIKVAVGDPLYQMVAGTMEIPANWKFAGVVARGGGCASTGAALKFTAQSPDGLTAIEAFPGSAWSWTADARLAQMQARQHNGCVISQSTSAAEFLKDVALPRLRPDAQLLGIDKPNAKWQARIDAHLAEMNANSEKLARSLRGYKAVNTLEGALARVRTTVNGQPADEEIGTQVTCTSTWGPGGFPVHPVERRQCRAVYVGVKRTPPGGMDKERDSLEAMVESYRPDPAWSARMQQDAEKAMQQSIDNNNAMTQQIIRNGEAARAATVQSAQNAADQRASQQRIHDEQMAVNQRGTDMAMQRDREAQNATDTAAKRQAQVSLGRQTYVNPNTGQKIETTDQYSHVWRSSDGTTVLHTNDVTYDPNGRDNQTWTELTPTNP